MKTCAVTLTAVLVLLALNGCIVSSSPGKSDVSLQARETLTFEVGVLPGDAEIEWHFDGEVLAGETGTSFTYAPAYADIGTHVLMVTEQSPLSGGDSCTWNITVLPSGHAVIESRQQAQRVLYAAYAGIGYGSAEVLTYADNAPLYNAIFADPNFLSRFLLHMAGCNTDIDGIVSLIFSLRLPFTFVYSDEHTGISATWTVVPYNLYAFHWFLSLDVPEGGHIIRSSTFTGVEGYNDIVATGIGVIDMNPDAYPGNSLDPFEITSMHITARETLSNVYADLFTVGYDDWEISYIVSDNWSVYRECAHDPDLRDYILKGDFTLNGQPYSFCNGVRYIQDQAEYSVDGAPVTLTLLDIGGDLSIPSLEGIVTVETPFDSDDPLGSGTILRDEQGRWYAGTLTISDRERDIRVAFTAEGAARFTDEGGALGDWTVESWQESLAP